MYLYISSVNEVTGGSIISLYWVVDSLNVKLNNVHLLCKIKYDILHHTCT